MRLSVWCTGVGTYIARPSGRIGPSIPPSSVPFKPLRIFERRLVYAFDVAATLRHIPLASSRLREETPSASFNRIPTFEVGTDRSNWRGRSFLYS